MKSMTSWSRLVRGMLDAKAAETCMLLDKIEKLTKAQNLIMDSLKI